MIRVILGIALFTYFFTGCSSSNSNPMEETETTSIANSLYTVQYNGLTPGQNNGKTGFWLSFSIIAEDKTRDITPSPIHLQFPQEIDDQKGNAYKRAGEPSYQSNEEKKHVIEVKQFFRGALNEDTTHLTVPARIMIEDIDDKITFENISEEMVPITRDELTISRLTREENVLTLEAEDISGTGALDWGLIIKEEKVYPVFTNTDKNEGGEYKGTLEFAFPPEETFTLTAERSQTPELEWELPFVLPVEQ
ncbi:hypothetical protein [Salibacterium aidingense]|uniref:hypothetical protein n=1 Tax=Salibacterium aidingense TaxID=384933 RepID=UPI003BD1A8D5